MTILEFSSDLRKIAWRTMGARFNASRRLKRRENFGVFSIAVFSMIGVGLAILERIYEFGSGTPLANFTTALSVALGFFVVIISLIESGNGASAKAEALYRNAEELSGFQRELGEIIAVQGDQIGREMLSKYRSEYESIKRRCPYNHEPIDDRAFRAEHPGEFTPKYGTIVCLFHRSLHYVHSFFYFAVLWAIVLALVVSTPWHDVRSKVPNSQHSITGGYRIGALGLLT